MTSKNKEELHIGLSEVLGEKVKWIMYFHDQKYAIYGVKTKSRLMDVLSPTSKKISIDKFKSKVNEAIKVLKNTSGVIIKSRKNSSDGWYSACCYGDKVKDGSASLDRYKYEFIAKLNAYTRAVKQINHHKERENDK